MQEKTLAHVSLAASILGILGLYILSLFVDCDLHAIADINPDLIGKTIRIQGEVQSIVQKEQLLFLEIQDETGEITVMLYTDEKVSVKKEEAIEIIGTVEEYNGALEIQAEKISLFDFQKEGSR